MCIKNINTNICCYKNVTTVNDNAVVYSQPISRIKVRKDSNDKLFTGPFVIAVQISMLGTDNASEKTNNVVEKRARIDFKIRITKINKDPAKRLSLDLDDFSIDLNNEVLQQSCYEFYNQTQVVQVNDLFLQGGAGQYVIKVLVKESDSDKWIVQSMSMLTMISSD